MIISTFELKRKERNRKTKKWFGIDLIGNPLKPIKTLKDCIHAKQNIYDDMHYIYFREI